jgi:hypothetical protein
MARPLSTIAYEIQDDWGEKVKYSAKPYLNAMKHLNSINDSYFNDSGRTIVAYFLENASTWRGETARRVKAELRQILKDAGW